MVIRFLRHLVVAAGLLLTACSVQFVSPYNAEIASGLVRLNVSILSTATDIAETAQDPQTRPKAAYIYYAKIYASWLAEVETMRTLSALGNPGALNCATVAQRLGNLPGLPPADMSELAGSDGGPAVDCQTLLFTRLKQRIERLAAYHKQFCTMKNPNILADCAGGFGAQVGVIHVNGDDEAVAVQPTLRTIRLLMRIQEVKKPTGPGL
jgi:hypothetical protein